MYACTQNSQTIGIVSILRDPQGVLQRKGDMNFMYIYIYIYIYI